MSCRAILYDFALKDPTQPNPPRSRPNPTQPANTSTQPAKFVTFPNPTQPNPWLNPTHGQL